MFFKGIEAKGIIKKSCKNIPLDISSAKLKRGEAPIVFKKFRPKTMIAYPFFLKKTLEMAPDFIIKAFKKFTQKKYSRKNN